MAKFTALPQEIIDEVVDLYAQALLQGGQRNAYIKMGELALTSRAFRPRAQMHAIWLQSERPIYLESVNAFAEHYRGTELARYFREVSIKTRYVSEEAEEEDSNSDVTFWHILAVVLPNVKVARWSGPLLDELLRPSFINCTWAKLTTLQLLGVQIASCDIFLALLKTTPALVNLQLHYCSIEWEPYSHKDHASDRKLTLPRIHALHISRRLGDLRFLSHLVEYLDMSQLRSIRFRSPYTTAVTQLLQEQGHPTPPLSTLFRTANTSLTSISIMTTWYIDTEGIVVPYQPPSKILNFGCYTALEELTVGLVGCSQKATRGYNGDWASTVITSISSSRLRTVVLLVLPEDFDTIKWALIDDHLAGSLFHNCKLRIRFLTHHPFGRAIGEHIGDVDEDFLAAATKGLLPKLASGTDTLAIDFYDPGFMSM